LEREGRGLNGNLKILFARIIERLSLPTNLSKKTSQNHIVTVDL
jgi:hypothetical protein